MVETHPDWEAVEEKKHNRKGVESLVMGAGEVS